MTQLGRSVLKSTTYFEMHLGEKKGLMDGWRNGQLNRYVIKQVLQNTDVVFTGKGFPFFRSECQC